MSGSAANRSTSRASSANSIPTPCSSSSTRRRAKCCARFATRRSTAWSSASTSCSASRWTGCDPRIILVVDVSNGADVVVGRRGMRTMRDLEGKSVAVESGALGAFVLSRALALNGMQASDVNVVHLESNEHPGRVREGPGRRRGHVRPVPRATAVRRRRHAVRQHADTGRNRRSAGRARERARSASEGDPGPARRLVRRARLHAAPAGGRGAPHGRAATDDRRAVPGCAERPAHSRRARKICACSGGRHRSWPPPGAG